MNKIFAVVALLFFSCQEHSRNIENNKLATDTGKMLIKNFPDDYNSRSHDQKIKWLDSALMLPSLKEGFAAKEIRIIEEYYNDKGTRIILRSINDKWSGEIIYYSGERDSSKRGLSVYPFKALSYQSIKLVSPKSGWANFSKGLSKYDLKFLKTQHSLPERHDLEKVVVFVEYLDQTQYTFNDFSDPNESSSKTSKELLNLLSFIKTEFGIKAEYK